MILLRARTKDVILPYRAHLDDAGWDLVSLHSKIIWPHTVCNLDTGWDIKVPANSWGSIKTRSSTFKNRKLLVLEGVIDSNYTGPLSVLVFNPTFIPKIVRKGDRLAQLLIMARCDFKFNIVEDMPITTRGPHGFGHTGR